MISRSINMNKTVAEKRLEEFKQIVSWADDCVISHVDGWDYITTKSSNLFLMDWQNVDTFVSELKELRFHFGDKVRIGAVIDGDCSDYDCGRINDTLARCGVCIYWIGIRQAMLWGDWILNISDGSNIIQDWIQKTLNRSLGSDHLNA
jgi:hypothetical protein